MELPTNEQVEALVEEATTILELPEKEWKLIGTENGSTVYTRKYKNHSMRMVKVVTVLKHPIEEVSKGLTNVEERVQWDPMCKSATRVKQFDVSAGHVSIIHVEMAGLGIISPRDMVSWVLMRADGAGGYFSASKSVNNSEKEIPIKKDIIRADMVINGAKLEKITVEGVEGTRLISIALVDPKGMIPKINLKPMFMKGTQTMQAFSNHLKKKAEAKA